MRHERVYARRQRAVTFAGAIRTVTILLDVADFERLEQLATKHNVGNATLGRQIIRKFLKRRSADLGASVSAASESPSQTEAGRLRIALQNCSRKRLIYEQSAGRAVLGYWKREPTAGRTSH